MARVTDYVVFLWVLAVVHTKTVCQDKAKKDLEEYIVAKKSEINPRYRLHYHIAPPVGWMNDPNGFSYYKGQYHIFYQFHPYDSVPGAMHWGHMTSPNLVEWNQLPTALLPDEEVCFSGSAVVRGDFLILMYTGHETIHAPPLYKETQYLAFSDDGIEFHKYIGNPVLQLPQNGSSDFRDPKVWKHGDYWYVIIGSKNSENRGRVLLYRSKNLIKWEFIKVLAESKGDTGFMWECPDFFELNGKFILLLSAPGINPIGDRYKNALQTGYIIGKFNYETFDFLHEVGFQELDYGHHFYAAQTNEFNGKRYLIAWFAMWNDPYPKGDGWNGALTMVRELKLVGTRILMRPVDEMVELRKDVILIGDLQQNQVIVLGKTGEIKIIGDLEQQIELFIKGKNGGDEIRVKWDPNIKKVVVDRSNDVRQVEWNPIGSHSWRIFLDASSLELFCGEGEVVFSSRVFPDGDWMITNLSTQTLQAEAYTLKRSVPE